MNPTPIEVDGGLIEGEILINDLNDEPYYSFKGVPYARPPTGSLRFQVISVTNFSEFQPDLGLAGIIF